MDPIELMRKGRIKRYFRATRKLTVPGLISHITQRAAGKEPLFLEDSDYLDMLGLLKEVAGKHALQLYAFCLMPNHVHLLLSPREGGLHGAMRALFAQYATRFNRKYERKGHLFGGPYRQAVCLDEAYLLAASLYIHLNPVKAGLVEDPAKYRWSSCRIYSGERSPKTFVDPGLVLGMLAPDGSQARRRYAELLGRGFELRIKPVSEEKNAVEIFLSGLGARLPRLWVWLRERRREGKSHPTLAEAGEPWEERIAELRRGGFRHRPKTRAAVRHLIEQLCSRGYRREEIAQRLGVSRKTVYNLLRS